MMKLSSILTTLTVMGVAAWGQTPNAVVYDHFETGFQFTYPSQWKLKKHRDHITLTIPFDEVKRSAILEVYGVSFTGEIPTWQAVQTNTAQQLKREIVRQWQEEVLTVPMLMARTKWTKNEVDFTSDSAMVYADTRRRLVFRLESTTEDFDRANEAFRTVLQSLRPIDGRLPKPFDPSKPESENLRRPDNDGKSGVWTKPRVLPVAPVKGDLTVETVAGNIAVLIRYAGQWKWTHGESGTTATTADVADPATLRVYSNVESDPPGRALMRASSSSLASFTKVLKREESTTLTNKAGASYAFIWREGTTEGGNLFSLDVAVASPDYYILLHWRTTNAATAKRSRDRVLELVNTLSSEVKPSGGN